MWCGMDILHHVADDMVDDLAAWTYTYHEGFYSAWDKRGAWGLADHISSLPVFKFWGRQTWDLQRVRLLLWAYVSWSSISLIPSFHCFIVSSRINTVGPKWQSSSNSLLNQVPSDFGWFKFQVIWVELQGIQTVLRKMPTEHMVYSPLHM